MKHLALLAVLVFTIVQGCGGCTAPKMAILDETTGIPKPPYHIDPEILLASLPHFSYKSDVSLVMRAGEETNEVRERITIIGRSPRMHMKKTVDDYHFFEVFKEGDELLVKNQEGGFRKVDNISMYQEIFSDAFNATSSYVEQFSLEKFLTADGKNKSLLRAKNVIINSDAPFMKMLAEKIPAFSSLESSLLNADITMDEKSQIPIETRINVSINGKDNHLVTLTVVTTLETHAQTSSIVMPKISEDETVNVPVNSASRFNERLEQKRGTP